MKLDHYVKSAETKVFFFFKMLIIIFAK